MTVDISTPQKAIEHCASIDMYEAPSYQSTDEVEGAYVETFERRIGVLDDIFQSYDLPFDRDDVSIVLWSNIFRARAALTPIARGFEAVDKRKWVVSERPSGYHIDLPASHVHDLASTMRHELAHAADFHENLQTTEKTGTHSEWLDYLDTF